MKITLHPAAMAEDTRTSTRAWYDDQDDRLNDSWLPPFPALAAIHLTGEGTATLDVEQRGCMSAPGRATMRCDRPPPIDLAARGVHVTR